MFRQKEVRRRWKEDFLLVVTLHVPLTSFNIITFGVINFHCFFSVLGLMEMTSWGTDYIRKSMKSQKAPKQGRMCSQMHPVSAGKLKQPI